MTLRAPSFTVMAGIFTAVVAGCAKDKASEVRPPPEECRYQIDEGYKELDRAKSGNPSAMADIMRATGYLSYAAVQRQFEKYPECIDRAQHARDLMKPYVK